MPLDLAFHQARLVRSPSGETEIAARSPGFLPQWEVAAKTMAERFGLRPTNVTVPFALAVLPLGRQHVAVVQIRDEKQASDPPLLFRFLILSRRTYEAIGDPFLISDRFPFEQNVNDPLASLDWHPIPQPQRTLESTTAVLKAGESPLLLGATQALVDGARLLVKRDAPDETFWKSLWQLLPDRTRVGLSFATFAFSDDLGFHFAALPTLPEKLPIGAITETQATDYPDGRYELALQIAVDHENEIELQRLFARRSSADMLKFALMLLALAAIATIAVRLAF